MNITRWAKYLILNVFVSASVAVAVLMYWDKYQRPYVSTGPNPVENVTVDYGESQEYKSEQVVSNESSNSSTIYYVSAGDTIGSIALQFNLTVEELMQANNISDPNRLSIDQQLVIPGTQSLEPTTRPMATESVKDTVTVFESDTLPVAESSHRLEIRSVNSIGNVESERLILVNWGPTVSLLGWSIVSSAGETYNFPELSLYENGQVTVHTAVGKNTVTDLYWGKSESAWEPGITMNLVDSNGHTRANYDIQ